MELVPGLEPETLEHKSSALPVKLYQLIYYYLLCFLLPLGWVAPKELSVIVDRTNRNPPILKAIELLHSIAV